MGTERLLFRSIREEDLPAVYEIASRAGPGFTSFPYEKELIRKKLFRALQSFQSENAKEAGTFFFALDDLDTGNIVGTAGIDASVSYESPFYSYSVRNLLQESSILKKKKEHIVLSLENRYHHTSVLCSLVLNSEYRGKKRGQFLSRARFLFISEFPELFTETLMSDIRGRFEEDGTSPFWEGLGKKFLDLSYREMNRIVANEGTQSIAELLPKYPVYAILLPKAALDVIGKPHLEAEPALYLLKKEGMAYHHGINIMDGGPLIEAKTEALKTVRHSQILKVRDIQPQVSGNLYMVSNRHKKTFKASFGRLEVTKEGVILEQRMAEMLEVEKEDSVRIAVLD